MDRAPTLPGRWESQPLPVNSAAMNFVATHGRGHKPRRVEWLLVCIAAGDQDYVPGDELNLSSIILGANPVTQGRNGNQCWFQANFAITSLVFMNRKNTAAFNPTVNRWAVRCIAEW